MSEAFEEAIDELRFLASEINSRASDCTYGYFHGGDPRNFSPDPECCTDDEIQRHRDACASWEAGNGNPAPAPHCAFMNGGKAPAGFGLGMNHYEDADMVDWADRILRAVDRIVRG